MSRNLWSLLAPMVLLAGVFFYPLPSCASATPSLGGSLLGPASETASSPSQRFLMNVDDQRDYQGRIMTMPLGASAPYTCVNSVTMCNQNIFVAASGLGSIKRLTVPSPYVHQPFTLECRAVNGVVGYVVTDDSAVTCTLQSCSASNVTVCGAQIPVPGGTMIGDDLELPLTEPTKTDAPTYGAPTFTAQCVDGGDAPVYQVTDTSRISCDQFPCQASTLEICGEPIPIPGGTLPGGMQHLAMPPPFTHDSFTVQCLGSQGSAPSYQLIEHDAVTCNKLPQPHATDASHDGTEASNNP